jgi:hypothetical protein
VDDAGQGFDAGFQFRSLRCSVDVPGVSIPWRHVADTNTRVEEGGALAFGGRVVVLDAQEARPDPVLRLWAGVSEHGQQPGLDPAV